MLFAAPLLTLLHSSSLREVAPEHVLLKETAMRESAFDRAASRYTLAM